MSDQDIVAAVNRYMDADWLQANCRMAHYFGLGFIQVKINEYHRMHFYIPGLEPIVPEEDLHNHRYDFQSTIMRGGLTQELWRPVPHEFGTHVIEGVTCEEGAEPSQVPGRFFMTMDSRHTYSAGSSYFIMHEQFHRILPGPKGCITMLNRGVYRKDLAQVAKPIGGDAVCPFSKKIPEDELWRLVREALS